MRWRGCARQFEREGRFARRERDQAGYGARPPCADRDIAVVCVRSGVGGGVAQQRCERWSTGIAWRRDRSRMVILHADQPGLTRTRRAGRPTPRQSAGAWELEAGDWELGLTETSNGSTPCRFPTGPFPGAVSTSGSVSDTPMRLHESSA
jgi:hypothetical protein